MSDVADLSEDEISGKAAVVDKSASAGCSVAEIAGTKSGESPAELPAEAKAGKELRLRVLVDRAVFDDNRHLAEAFHAGSRIGQRFPYQSEKIDKLIDEVLAHPERAVIIMAEYDGEVIGFARSTIASFLSSDLARIAYVQLLYIAPEWRKSVVGGKALIALLRAMLKWAKTREATDIMVEIAGDALDSGIPKLLNKSGFEKTGESYHAKL